MTIEAAIKWFSENIRYFAILAACGALIAFGHTWGAAGVQSDWDKEKIAQAKAISDKEDEWKKKSAAYQATIASQRKRIQANKREVQNAINKNYPDCVADANIVELWQGSFAGESTR